jgi:NTE family protein
MWIDGVFSGGGVKAFAFVGALGVMEERGYRFKRVAGTSAGSIIAAFVAAGFTSKEIHQEMDDLQPKLFMDQDMIHRFPFIRWIGLYKRLGLYRGKNFETWMDTRLAEKGIKTFGDLEKGALTIIASDLTNGKMLVFPDDLPSYGINPDHFQVSKAVRMSCSLPFFFQPLTLFNKDGEKCIIVDGGVISNFPVWVYEENQKPPRPYLGFQLRSKNDYFVEAKINNAFDLFKSLFETMKEAHDAKYISKDVLPNIVFLPVEYMKTSNFKLSKLDQEKLVQIGRDRTQAFIKKWTH